jgi:hypothetical protein
MTADEERAYHRGKYAARVNEGESLRGERIGCEFRKAELVAAWKRGYAEQCEAQAPRVARTLEQEAKVAGFVDACKAWLERNK